MNSRIAKSSTMSDARAGELSESCLEAPVGMTTGELGEKARAGREQDVVTPPAGEMPECAGDVALADSDRPVDDEPLAGRDELEPGEVTDLGRGELRR